MIKQGVILRVIASNIFVFLCPDVRSLNDYWIPSIGDILFVVEDPHRCESWNYCFTVLHTQYGIGHVHLNTSGRIESLFEVCK
jgi:hypothetical protein